MLYADCRSERNSPPGSWLICAFLGAAFIMNEAGHHRLEWIRPLLSHWHKTTVAREGQVKNLKKEIKTRLAESAEPPRHGSVEDGVRRTGVSVPSITGQRQSEPAPHR